MHKQGIQKLIGFGLIALTVALSAYGFVLNQRAETDTTGAFWDAIASVMTTKGITCTVYDNTGNAESNQAVSLDLVSKTDAKSATTLKQNGTTVTTEGISTKTDDYVRYTIIQSKQKDASGKPLDFSKVLHIWGMQDHPASAASLYEQTVLGGCVVPLAHLSHSQADMMVRDMQKNKVFQTDTAKAEQAKNDDGVKVLKYTVTVPPSAYVPFMKRFALAAGLPSLGSVDAGAFNGKAPRSVVFSISAKDHRLRKISFAGLNHTVTFADYDKQPAISVPTQTVPLPELLQRLQAIK